METKKTSKPIAEVISYITLRRIIGILGFSFPFVMIIGTVCCGDCQTILPSISAYYHTSMRNLFVGYLCSLALFLYAYRGYNGTDNIVGNLAGIFALGGAFFPTSVLEPLGSCILYRYDNQIFDTIHNVSAGGFLLSLAYFSYYLFTITDEEPSKMKLFRNKCYRWIGRIMLACVLLILVYFIFKHFGYLGGLKKCHPVFWLETVALCSFGISWFIKGRAILMDVEEQENKPAQKQQQDQN